VININFDNESEHKYLPGKIITRAVELVAKSEIKKDCSIGIVICSDSFIHDLNKNYLNHDYPTDVITFEIEEEPLEGEIYISADTAKSQSEEYNVAFKDELIRLAIHGCLHLAGFTDSTDEERKIMSGLEDKYLNLVKVNS
jgi:rRNA maturation RNase YbeY